MMKRILAWLLVLAAVMSLFGCAAPAPAQTAATAEAAAEDIPEETAPAEDTEPPAPEGSLFLKVSSITFSLVGESEDIYLGVVPREQVIWESADPSVVSVEDGILTANGVGTTTVTATCGDRQISCTAGCLAQTQQELDGLDYNVLCTPKRLPPEVDLSEPCSYFDNAAIVGDSITYFLMQWESKTNYLGDILFLAKGGVSMNGFVRRFKNINYQGQEMNLEDAIGKSGVKRVYFLMGSNDVMAPTQRPYVYDNWLTMIDRIREQAPDIELVLMTQIPLYDEEPFSPANDDYINTHNALIAEYDANLRQLAEDNGCLFLDLAYYVQDHCGRMPEIYNQGSYHMNEAGCLNWMKILRYYAQYELEGGTLS